MGKVPDYNLRAINKYNSKFDRVAVNLPIGSKERIKDLTGKSCNAYISALVLSDLDRIETERAAASDPIGGRAGNGNGGRLGGDNRATAQGIRRKQGSATARGNATHKAGTATRYHAGRS